VDESRGAGSALGTISLTMNATHYLYAAYLATGVIHLCYLSTVVARYRQVRKKIRELKIEA
jgi:hypothetical protein